MSPRAAASLLEARPGGPEQAPRTLRWRLLLRLTERHGDPGGVRVEVLGLVDRRGDAVVRRARVSYRLLGCINSACFVPRQAVRSIGQALALPGVESLRTLGCVVRGCQHRRQACRADHHRADPPPVLRVRRRIPAGSDPGELFTLRLFSVIDALVDTPITGLLTKLPFPPTCAPRSPRTTARRGGCRLASPPAKLATLTNAQTIIPNADQLYPAVLT
jgi:hypothetical protein